MTKKASEKRWTKQEFIELVDPCNKYRFRIWWFFLWRKQATLLNVLNAWFINPEAKCYVVRNLEWEFYFEEIEIFTSYQQKIKALRHALLSGE